VGEARISPEQIHTIEEQVVAIEDWHSAGLILDIGGGGEGIIGRLKGERVVAIDTSRRELEECPAGPLKIEMDARALHFLDGAFGTITAFFALMYMRADDHPKVFAEAWRVLAPGGRMLLWEAHLPARAQTGKDVVLVRLRVRLPDAEVSTGYGVYSPETDQGMAYYVRLAEQAGFSLVRASDCGATICLELCKSQQVGRAE